MHTDNNTIMVSETKGVSVIDISKIIRIEAANNYSKLILTDGRRLLVSKVLKSMETLLKGKGFERIHRSHLVNASCIQRYNLYQMTITLHNDEQLSMSRRRRTDIRRRMAESRVEGGERRARVESGSGSGERGAGERLNMVNLLV